MATIDAEGELRLFVYGTLRPGRSNWSAVRSRCRRHEPAGLPGYALYALDHPAVVPADPVTDEPAPTVAGDLLVLDGPAVAALERLDAFEGYDAAAPDTSYYVRARLAVVLASGLAVDAWVYLPGARLLAQVHPGRRVPGDDWFD